VSILDNEQQADRPDVSVVTPAFNAQLTIERTVRSVAAQTYPVAEHIVVDDGSTDGTLTLLRRLAAEYRHLQVLEQKNMGAGAARNRGIAAARGKYIAFLDSDDVWAEDKLELQLGFMEKDSVAFSYGDYLVMPEQVGQITGCFETPASLAYADLLRGCPIGCLTAAYNQQALGKVYMPNVRRGQDWGLWLAITRGGVVARKYPGVAAVYLQRSGSLSKNKLRKLGDMYRIYAGEERLSVVASIYYLIVHSLYVRRKRPSDLAERHIAKLKLPADAAKRVGAIDPARS
jgi:teichuronic acid biosynthesis glycosyltransferase TuaG